MHQFSNIESLALALVLVLYISYYFYVAPRVAASIASRYGKNEKSWRVNIWFFNIVATIYLLFFLKNINHKDQRTLALVSLGYIIVFASFGLLDIFTAY